MNIVVVGQGAVGLLWYHKLKQQTQNHVCLLCSASADASVTDVNFTSLNGVDEKSKLIHADENDLTTSDLVIFCVKAYQLAQAIKQYISFVKNDTPIILCHNGMINENLLPKSHTFISMLLTHGAKLSSPFFVQHTGEGNSDIGAINGDLASNKQEQLIGNLKQALPSVNWYNDIKDKQWTKLAINCVINPLTAIDNCENGEIIKSQYKATIENILSEIVTLAKCNEVALSVKELERVVLDVAQKTAKNCSSMRSDINANRTTEIDHINGFVHQQGQLHSVATPANSQLWQKIKSLEAQST